MNENKGISSLPEAIVSIAQELKLQAFAQYKDYVKADMSKEEAIYDLLKLQKIFADDTRYKNRIKNASFPVVKTLDTFVFDSDKLPYLDKDQVMELFTCKFVKDKRNVVAIGPSGTGKTHLLTALCVEAATKGHKVKFLRASDIVIKMSEAAGEKSLANYLKKINSFDVLFIDELGYLAFDPAGASLLFRVLADRYEVKSTVVSSNLEFSKWVPMFGNDEQLTSALIGRLVDRSVVLNMNGENYRLKRAGVVKEGDSIGL